MKRFVGFFVIVLLLVGLAGFAGCAQKESKEGANNLPQGTLKFNEKTNKIEVTTNGKTKSWTVSEIAEKALDVPVPQGVTLAKGSAVVISSPGAPQKWSGATFWSDQDVAQIVTFYQGELKSMPGYSDMSVSMEGQQIGMFRVGSGDSTKSVIITAGQSGDPGKSMITVATVSSGK